jgi:hypothetical protein
MSQTGRAARELRVGAEQRSDVMAMFEAVPGDLKTNEREAQSPEFSFSSPLLRVAHFVHAQLRNSMSTRTGCAGKTI